MIVEYAGEPVGMVPSCDKIQIPIDHSLEQTKPILCFIYNKYSDL